MMDGIWTGGLTSWDAPAPTRPGTAEAQFGQRIRELEHHIARLTLLNQAMWELLREKLQLKDEDLARLAHEVDLRDGVEDDMMTAVPLECPSCGRVSSSKHWKCLYCGQLFEKPIMG